MGIALTGSISSETNFISLNMDFTITEEPKLQLLSDSDFSSDVKLCMQLSQPEIVMRSVYLSTISWLVERFTLIKNTFCFYRRHEITKEQLIPGYTVRRKMNFVHRLPGFTHYLNQKNNDMCNSILS